MSYKFSTGSVYQGDIFYEDDRTGERTYIDFGQDTITFRPSGSAILHAKNDSVGIGTTSPTELLTLNGAEPNIQFKEGDVDRAKIGINDSDNLVVHNQVSNRHIVFKINDGGQTREAFRIRGNSDAGLPEVVVNEGDDSLVDFRVETDNQTHMLYVDGSLDRTGVMTNSPKSSFHIAGSLSVNLIALNAANDPGSTYNCTATDHVILVNTRPAAQGGIDSALTITLPDAGSSLGRVIIVKDAAGYSDVNSITVARQGSDTIDGIDQTRTLGGVAGSFKFISDGSSAWYEIT
jgi:hypothetical protein